MLKSSFHKGSTLREAGCDEAGRGCLAGPVFAAAVVLPKGFRHPLLNDSKQVAEHHREELRVFIEAHAEDWAVGFCSPEEIDAMNILRASFHAMHKAIGGLRQAPDFLLIDGNRFTIYPGIPHRCFVKGDAIYKSIAAASILAKTYRDQYMAELADAFPQYGWRENKGYPTPGHRKAIAAFGMSPHHRKSFRQLPGQLSLFDSSTHPSSGNAC